MFSIKARGENHKEETSVKMCEAYKAHFDMPDDEQVPYFTGSCIVVKPRTLNVTKITKIHQFFIYKYNCPVTKQELMIYDKFLMSIQKITLTIYDQKSCYIVLVKSEVNINIYLKLIKYKH